MDHDMERLKRRMLEQTNLGSGANEIHTLRQAQPEPAGLALRILRLEKLMNFTHDTATRLENSTDRLIGAVPQPANRQDTHPTPADGQLGALDGVINALEYHMDRIVDVAGRIERGL